MAVKEERFGNAVEDATQSLRQFADARLVGELVPVKIERASTAVLYGSLALAGVES